MNPTSLEIGAAYIRVSTNDQTELSPDAQLREIKNAAKADGILIPEELIFIEERGVSGRRADNRKQFQKMISVAKQQPSPFEYLYLWKFSRFARNQEESMFYKGILRKKCGVTIKSVSEPIMDGMFGRLIESIIEWSDEYYSINLSGEVLRGMTEKAMREGYQSSPCLGYNAVGEGKPFVINEEEYKIVEYIHKSYYNGLDMSAIARNANDHGYLTKRGNPFNRRAVETILKNKFYSGVVTWKEISFQGSHEVRESIASVFDDNQVRLMREYRPLSRREASSCIHWASGLLKCGCCGASLGYNKTAATNRNPSFFQCWKYAKGIHKESCSITVSKVEKLILESLKNSMLSGNVEYEYVRSIPQNEARQRILTALSKLSLKEQRVKDAYQNGVDSLEEYRINKERILTERLELKNALEEVAKENTRDKDADKKELLSRIKNAYDVLLNPEIDYETKGNVLRGVVKKIIYDKQNNQLNFFYYLSI